MCFYILKQELEKQKGGTIISTVYVKVRHWLFWYGVYGFCPTSCNDEITLYSDKELRNFLGYFELTTETSLRYLLDHELDKTEDKNYCEEIENFLNSQKVIHYSYIYPRNVEDVSDQVSHFAPINENGHKPVYIEMWSKLSRSWDIDQLKMSVRILAKDFLHMEICNVELLEVPTHEETRLSLQNEYKPFIK
ncbi:hypothetical protein PBOR_29495 [Paenibacillus borealis]|uniref:Uncharacterized protein n=1 Tax=Paenibacillus borealis TaxID=160799 RepID=A0A089LIA7_PAEBO|nr:hypothetical protein PBOR_29495 [Paenibacillus borealis]